MLSIFNDHKWRKRLFSVPLLLSAFTPALAEGPGWTGNVTILQVVNTANGGVNIYMTPSLTACQSQSGYGGEYASLYPNHPSINRIKADLLVALTTGAKMRFYLGDNMCTVSETILLAP